MFGENKIMILTVKMLLNARKLMNEKPLEFQIINIPIYLDFKKYPFILLEKDKEDDNV